MSHGVRAFQSIAQSIANNSAVALTFDTVDFDTDGYRTSSTNYTIPTGLAGYYAISASLTWAATASQRIRSIAINVNGTAVAGSGSIADASSTDDAGNCAQCIVQLAVGDVVTVTAFQLTGVALNTGVFQEEVMISMTLIST